MKKIQAHARCWLWSVLRRYGAGGDAVLPMAAKPEEVGLSSAQLKRLEEVTAEAHRRRAGARRGHAGGAARQDRVGLGAGQARPGRRDAMKPDSIFRIYSMTKPIVSVALMQMVEEGRLQVSDPVSQVPARDRQDEGRHRGRRRRQAGAAAQRSRARPMTVQDLLRHTAGLTYGSARQRRWSTSPTSTPRSATAA